MLNSWDLVLYSNKMVQQLFIKALKKKKKRVTNLLSSIDDLQGQLGIRGYIFRYIIPISKVGKDGVQKMLCWHGPGALLQLKMMYCSIHYTLLNEGQRSTCRGRITKGPGLLHKACSAFWWLGKQLVQEKDRTTSREGNYSMFHLKLDFLCLRGNKLLTVSVYMGCILESLHKGHKQFYCLRAFFKK